MVLASHRVFLGRKATGFTLVELLVVIAVAGIVTALALPSFMSQIRKSRRSDAIDVVARVQQAQERWRASNPLYTTLANLGIAAASPGGYYTVATAAGADAAAANTYTVTATAVAGKTQAGDAGCTTLTLTVAGGTPSYTPAKCWSR